MPDYDSKNIPTLDDIIEDDEYNTADLNSRDPDNRSLEPRSLNSNDLNSRDLDSTGHDHTDLYHSNLDRTGIINVDLNTASKTDAHTEDRAEAENCNLDLFLDKPSEQQSDLPETSADKIDQNIDASPVFDVAPSETLKITLDPSELETIVESVVNNLLPDLEQHLRTQLRQTLENKLREEVSTLLNSETTQNSNTS